MSKSMLYSDKHIQIFEDKIRFKSWCLPWGKKDVKLEHVKKVSEKNMGLFSGRLRISGSNNFRDWFRLRRAQFLLWMLKKIVNLMEKIPISTIFLSF